MTSLHVYTNVLTSAEYIFCVLIYGVYVLIYHLHLHYLND